MYDYLHDLLSTNKFMEASCIVFEQNSRKCDNRFIFCQARVQVWILRVLPFAYLMENTFVKDIHFESAISVFSTNNPLFNCSQMICIRL